MAYDKSLTPKLVAEFVGTLALVLVGVLAIENSPSLLGVAFAHGLTIAVMASATMLVSGAHFNPAVTFGVWLAKRMDGRTALAYVATQLVAAAVGAFLVSIVLPDADLADGTPSLAGGVSVGSAILLEAILTFFLVFVVFGTGVDPRFGARIGGLAIGLTVTLDILAGGPLTGAAMNPARWFGPALVGSAWDDALVYLVGPLAGGAAGALVYAKMLMAKGEPA